MPRTMKTQIIRWMTVSVGLLLCMVLATPAFAQQRESLSGLRTDVDSAQADADANASDIQLHNEAICALAAAAGLCDDIAFCTGIGSCTPKTVFITSTIQNGNLEGLTGADAICQSLADAASLPGTYLAWLSAGGDTEPSSRFTRAIVPYAQVDGTRIADDWADLTDGSLQAPIDVNENGENTSPIFVWTNALTNGAGRSGIADGTCSDWTTGIGTNGLVGRNDETGAEWTDIPSFQPCELLFRLYCFAQ